MIIKNKKFLLSSLLTYFLPRAARAENFWDRFIGGAKNTATNAQLPGAEAEAQADTILGSIGSFINGILVFLGVLFLLLIIYGGFLWMTSAGNVERVTPAKKIITASFIGLAIILLGQVITIFVIYLF